MKKQYTHPAPCAMEHKYKHDMYELEDYIQSVMTPKYHKGHLQHLGGAASFHDHITDLYYGHVLAIKKELKRVIDYLYMYAMTGHDIYCFLAEDAYKHVEQLQEDVRDPDEKEHVQYFLQCVKEYMSWLKTEKDKGSTNGVPHQTLPHPIHGMGSVNL